jgi:hypothetical protein
MVVGLEVEGRGEVASVSPEVASSVDAPQSAGGRILCVSGQIHLSTSHLAGDEGEVGWIRAMGCVAGVLQRMSCLLASSQRAVQWPDKVHWQGCTPGHDGGGRALLSFGGMAAATSCPCRHRMVATTVERLATAGFIVHGCQGQRR